MRSLIRSMVLVAAVSAPLVALAASSSDTAKTQAGATPSQMNCRDTMHKGHDAESKRVPDKLKALGGQNGWINSFNSP